MLYIEPRRDRVLVECGKEDERTAFGLLDSDKAEENPRQGKIVTVGSGRILESGAVIPVSLKEGDRVLVGGGMGEEVMLNGKTYLILREDDILAILKEH